MSKPALLLVVLACSATPLHAVPMDIFTLTSGTDVTTFSLPVMPTPTTSSCSPVPGQCFFIVDGVAAVVDGTSITADIDFYSLGYSGGLTVFEDVGGVDTALIKQQGPQLFLNPVTAPTFVPNPSIALTEYTIGAPPVYAENFNLSIVPAAAAPTPEPSAFLLLGTGLAGALGAARGRLSRR